jgi:hypothetical protein
MLVGPSLAKGIGYVEDLKAMDHDGGSMHAPSRIVSDSRRVPGQQDTIPPNSPEAQKISGFVFLIFMLCSTVGTVHHHNTIRIVFI